MSKQHATQLSLFPVLAHQEQTTREPQDLEGMRAWLLDWGARHNYPAFSFPFHYPPRNTDKDRRFGLLYKSREAWLRDTKTPPHYYPPYNERENYPGEWLVKCIEHVKRFDSGERALPWQENRDE